MYTPVHLSYYIKVGFKGVSIIQACFRDDHVCCECLKTNIPSEIDKFKSKKKVFRYQKKLFSTEVRWDRSD